MLKFLDFFFSFFSSMESLAILKKISKYMVEFQHFADMTTFYIKINTFSDSPNLPPQISKGIFFEIFALHGGPS